MHARAHAHVCTARRAGRGGSVVHMRAHAHLCMCMRMCMRMCMCVCEHGVPLEDRRVLLRHRGKLRVLEHDAVLFGLQLIEAHFARLDGRTSSQLLLHLSRHAQAVAKARVVLQVHLVRLEAKLAHQAGVMALDPLDDLETFVGEALQLGREVRKEGVLMALGGRHVHRRLHESQQVGEVGLHFLERRGEAPVGVRVRVRGER